MKRFCVLVIFLGCVFVSSAGVAVEEVPHEENKIISISRTTTQVNIESNTLNLSEENAQKLKKIATKGPEESRAAINDIADDIIGTVKQQLLMGGGDPSKLDDYTIGFEYRPLLISYTGTLDLSIGSIQDLSSFSRSSDASVSWSSLSPDTITVTIPLNFKNIIASHNFLMRVRGDTVEGVLYAWATETTAIYRAVINTSSLTLTSKSLELNIGSFEIDLYSVSMSSSYRSLITDLTTDLMEEVVNAEADDVVGGLLSDALLSVVDQIEF